MTIVVDLDGTICSEEKVFEKCFASVIMNARKVLIDLKNAGHTIIIHSARSWSEFKMTKKWLEDNNIPHDGLVLGKPCGDFYIDDKAITFTSWEDISNEIARRTKK